MQLPKRAPSRYPAVIWDDPTMARAALRALVAIAVPLRDLRSRKCILLLTKRAREARRRSSERNFEDQSRNISRHFAKEESFAAKFWCLHEKEFLKSTISPRKSANYLRRNFRSLIVTKTARWISFTDLRSVSIYQFIIMRSHHFAVAGDNYHGASYINNK
jgi:hypothetical protein